MVISDLIYMIKLSLCTFVLTFFFSGGCGHGGLFSGVQQVSLPVLHIS